MKIIHKFLLVVMIPITALVALAIFVTEEHLVEVWNLEDTQHTLRIAPHLNSLVHELQRERGLSAGYLARQNTSVHVTLQAQRIVTDAALESFDDVVTEEKAFIGKDLLRVVSNFGESLSKLSDIRQKVDAGDYTIAEMAREYTHEINDGLEVVARSENNLEQDAMRNAARTMFAIANAKERKGLERAMGTAGFDAGEFSLPLYNRFISLQAQEQVFDEEIRLYGNSETIAALQEISKRPIVTETHDLRNIAIEGGLAGKLNGTTGLVWFDHITQEIDAYKELEEMVALQLSGLAEQAISETWGKTVTIMVLVGAATLGAILISLFLGNRLISKPFKELVTHGKLLAEGKASDAKFLDRSDEFGELSQFFQIIQESASVSQRIIAATQNTSAQLMIVTKGKFSYLHPVLKKDLIGSMEGDQDPEVMIADGASLEDLHDLSLAVSRCERVNNHGEVSGFIWGPRRYDIHIADVLNDAGQDLGVVMEWRDVTEQRTIEEALSNLVTSAQEGDFSTRLDINSKEPVMASLIDGLNEVCSSVEVFIEDISATLTAMAAGDLTRSIQESYSGQLAGAANNCEATRVALAQLIEAIQGNGAVLETKIATLRDGSERLARRSESQAAVLEEASATMMEVADSVETTGKLANETNELVAEMQTQVASSNETMVEAVDSIQKIEAGSNAISEIITILQAISFQTNLLALNAAVEAARAGEAGSGFAVVAAEVRALAQRSSQAADDIDARIKTSSTDVAQGVTIIKKAGDALDEISETMEKTVERIVKMTESSQMQTLGVKEISETITEIDNATQENAQIAVDGAAASRDISREGEQLQAQTSKFSISARGAPAHIAAE